VNNFPTEIRLLSLSVAARHVSRDIIVTFAETAIMRLKPEPHTNYEMLEMDEYYRAGHAPYETVRSQDVDWTLDLQLKFLILP